LNKDKEYLQYKNMREDLSKTISYEKLTLDLHLSPFERNEKRMRDKLQRSLE